MDHIAYDILRLCHEAMIWQVNMNEIVHDIVRNTPNWAGGDAVPSLHRVPGTDMFMLLRDLQEDENEDRDP